MVRCCVECLVATPHICANSSQHALPLSGLRFRFHRSWLLGNGSEYAASFLPSTGHRPRFRTTHGISRLACHCRRFQTLYCMLPAAPHDMSIQDIDAHCQSYLLQTLPSNVCLFGDIMNVFGDGRQWTAALQEGPQTYAEKKQLLYDSASVYPRGYCFRHQRFCEYSSGSKLRVGGPPCTDHSVIGSRRGADGPTVGTVIAYGVKTESTSTAAVCFENVMSCPQWLKHDNLPSFSLQDFPVYLADFGFDAIRRDRLLKCSGLPTVRVLHKFDVPIYSS